MNNIQYYTYLSQTENHFEYFFGKNKHHFILIYISLVQGIVIGSFPTSVFISPLQKLVALFARLTYGALGYVDWQPYMSKVSVSDSANSGWFHFHSAHI